jgi:hypothetical protein
LEKGVVAVTTYHVRVERGDRYWLVHVVELDRWTQARTLRDVEPMARDLVATMAGAAPDSCDLTTDIALPDEVITHLTLAEQLREILIDAYATSTDATGRQASVRSS